MFGGFLFTELINYIHRIVLIFPTVFHSPRYNAQLTAEIIVYIVTVLNFKKGEN